MKIHYELMITVYIQTPNKNIEWGNYNAASIEPYPLGAQPRFCRLFKFITTTAVNVDKQITETSKRKISHKI
jgi:hypothetical protein